MSGMESLDVRVEFERLFHPRPIPIRGDFSELMVQGRQVGVVMR